MLECSAVKHFFIWTVLLGLISCQGQSGRISKRIITAQTLVVDTAFVPSDRSIFYFPPKHFEKKNKLDSFVNNWYSEQLFAMREPIIFVDKTSSEIYRFTWLRTFRNPIAIRIEQHGNNYYLYWKLCNGAGGYNPGQLIVNKQKTIDKRTWDEFKNKLNRIRFWNLKTTKRDQGHDGSEWILEGKKYKKYHVVDRWSPDRRSNYYQCCDFLIQLTDLQIKGNEKH